MNISTTFLNALKHTSSDVEGQRSPEILLGQIYKVSLEDKGFLLPLAGGEFRLLNPFYYEWNPFPSYLLLYTLEGSALLTTRDNEVILDHEHLLFLDCSQGFSLRLLQGKWRFQMFFLSGRELSSYYSIFEAYFTCCYPIPIGSCVSQRMQQLTKFPFTPTPAEQLQIHRELTGMFTELALSALSVSRDIYRRVNDDALRGLESIWEPTATVDVVHIVAIVASLVADLRRELSGWLASRPETDALWRDMEHALDGLYDLFDPEGEENYEHADDVPRLYAALRRQVFGPEKEAPQARLYLLGGRFWVAALTKADARDHLRRELGLVGLKAQGVPLGEKLDDGRSAADLLALAQTVPCILGRTG